MGNGIDGAGSTAPAGGLNSAHDIAQHDQTTSGVDKALNYASLAHGVGSMAAELMNVGQSCRSMMATLGNRLSALSIGNAVYGSFKAQGQWVKARDELREAKGPEKEAKREAFEQADRRRQEAEINNVVTVAGVVAPNFTAMAKMEGMMQAHLAEQRRVNPEGVAMYEDYLLTRDL